MARKSKQKDPYDVVIRNLEQAIRVVATATPNLTQSFDVVELAKKLVADMNARFKMDVYLP